MSAIKGTIFDVKRFSIHDGPGIRTTVFLKGCALRCAWCHNPESQARRPELLAWPGRCIRCGVCVDACPHGALSWNGGGLLTTGEACQVCGACVEACYAEARELVGRETSVAALLAEIERDRPFYDESGGGATFSGGEPLAQPEFLRAALQACRARDLHTALDTCGYAPWKILDRVRPFVDLFLYDLKLLDEARHRRFTGVSNALILSNLRALSAAGHEIVLRLPVIPGVNDDAEAIRRIGAFAAALPHSHPIDLLPYHRAAADKYERLGRTYQLGEIRPPTPEKMTEMAGYLSRQGLQVQIGG